MAGESDDTETIADPETDLWSSVAGEWADLWGQFADPGRRALVAATHIGPGSQVLDVGCATGEFVGLVAELGGIPAGIDLAGGMVDVARRRVVGADIRQGSVQRLPWPDRHFDVVTAVNSLQFAEDTLHALAEIERVLVPGGFVAIMNWAERELNQVDVVEAAIAAESDEERPPDDELRLSGGLATLLTDAGFGRVRDGIVPVAWTPADDGELVRGILLGEDEAALTRLHATIVDAARRFREADGSYRLMNAFRFAVGRRVSAE